MTVTPARWFHNGSQGTPTGEETGKGNTGEDKGSWRDQFFQWVDEACKSKESWGYTQCQEWIQRFKAMYPDDKSLESLIELDEKQGRPVVILQMEKTVDPRIGAVVGEIMDKLKELFSAGRIVALLKEYDTADKWHRPTPRQHQYHHSGSKWPNGELCPGPLPHLGQLHSDGRTTCGGIGNSFGTGKTETAVQSAEETISNEPDVDVAYCSFSNGYKSDAILRTLNEPGKYAGLWLYAAKHATRVVDGEVLGNEDMFKSIVHTYLKHPDWLLPTYAEEAHPKLIVIFDEVQEFNYDSLDSFISNTVVPTRTRASLLVGAFSPSFQFHSGNRMVDLNFDPPSAQVMKNIFTDKFGENSNDYLGVTLSELFGGVVRPLSVWKTTDEDIKKSDAVAACHVQYQHVMKRHTNRVLFRAAIADVACGRRPFEELFKRNSVSLGGACLHPVGTESYKVSLPPLEIVSPGLEIDSDDAVFVDCCRSVLRDFCSPTWQEFERLTGLAPALRIAALSDIDMQYDIDFTKTGILQLVFGSAIASNTAKSILEGCHVKRLPGGLKLRYVNGGVDILKLNLAQHFVEDHIVWIDMKKDHDALFDHILIVPLTDGEVLVIFIDSKFSEKGRKGSTTLDYRRDVRPKIDNYLKLLKLMRRPSWRRLADSVLRLSGKKSPHDWKKLVVLASNRHFAPSSLMDAEPVVVCASPHLNRLLSTSLVPPKYRT